MTPTMDCPVCGARYSEGTRACSIDGHVFVTAGEVTGVPGATGGIGAAPPPQASVTSVTSVDWAAPNVRLAKHSFNLAMLKVQRRFPDPTDSTPARFQAHLEALDNTLERLKWDSTPQLVQVATQAGAFLLCLAAGVPKDALGTNAVDSSPLPARYKACVREPAGVVASIESLAAFASGLFWSFLVFRPVENALANDPAAFANTVCQSLRELFYLTYPTVALKQQFLVEETFKVQNGYYPDSVRSAVEALLGRLQAVCQRGQQQVAAAPGAERNGFLALVAPLALTQVATMGAALTMGTVNPFPFRPLNAAENAAVEYILHYGLTVAPVPMPPPLRSCADVNAVLLAMREERAANAANAIALGRGGQLLPLYVLFEESHYWLTRLCNIFGARVAGSHDYTDLPIRAWQAPGMSWEKQKAVYAQADSDLAEALFPECGTVEGVMRVISRVNASSEAARRTEQAPPASAPAATSDPSTKYQYVTQIEATLNVAPELKTPLAFAGWNFAIREEGSDAWIPVAAAKDGPDTIDPGGSATVLFVTNVDVGENLHEGARYVLEDCGRQAGQGSIARIVRPSAVRKHVTTDADWRKSVQADLEVLSAPPDADFAELAVMDLRDVLARHGVAAEALAKMNQSELAAAARSALQQP